MVFLLQKVHQIWHNSLLRAIRCTVQVTDTSFSVLFCQSAYQVHSFLGGIRTAQDKGRGKLGVINTPSKRNCHLHFEPSVWCWLWPVVNWCIDLPGNYVRLFLIVIFNQLLCAGIERTSRLFNVNYISIKYTILWNCPLGVCENYTWSVFGVQNEPAC